MRTLPAAAVLVLAALVLAPVRGAGEVDVPRSSHPVLPTSVIDTAPGSAPEAHHYGWASEIEVPHGDFFNARVQETLLDVTLVGFRLVFDPRETGHRLNDYDGAENLRSLVLVAEEIVIRGPLHLPGTGVELYARVLRFAGDGRIETTPRPWTGRALDHNAKDNSARRGQDGQPGGDAGSIQVVLKVLDAPGSAARFVMNGAAGQDPGHGANGRNGRSCKDVRSSTKRVSKHFKYVTYIDNSLFLSSIRFKPSGVKIEKEYGSKSCRPSSGTNATPGGTPGAGGNGGRFIGGVDRDLGTLVESVGGAPGKPLGGYTGGKAGGPAKWVHVKDDGIKPKVSYSWKNDKRYKVPRNGSSWKATTAEPGRAGERVHLVTDVPWLRPELLALEVERVRDTYLAGDVPGARRLVVDYLEKLGEDGLALGERSGYVELHHEMILLGWQLQSGLDYFGNPPGWAPMLSLRTLRETYERQVDPSVSALVLGHWLEARWEDEQERLRLLDLAIRDWEADAAYQRASIEHAQALLPELRAELDEIDAEAREVLAEVRRLERQVSKDAQTREARKGALEAVATTLDSVAFGALMFGPKGAVVAAPLMAISTGIRVGEAIEQAEHNAAKRDPDNTARALDALLGDDDVEAARRRLASMSVLDAADAASYAAELDELAEVLSDATAEEVRAQVMANAGSWDQIDFEMLKRNDPEFRAVFDDAIEVVTRRQLFAWSVQEALYAADSAALRLAEGRSAIDQMKQARRQGRLDGATLASVRALRERARERLVRFRYYLVKACEYRLLEPCEIDYTTSRAFDTLLEHFGGSGEDPRGELGSQQEMARTLSVLFKEDLQRLEDRIVSEFSRSRVDARAAQLVLTLTPGELARLDRDGVLAVDLGSRLLSDRDRNARIGTIRVLECPFRGGAPRIDCAPAERLSRIGGAYGNLEVTLEPADWAILHWKDDVYLFRYGIDRDVSLVRWGFTWNVATGFLHLEGSDQIAEDLGRDGRVEFRPGARTELTIRKSGGGSRIEALSLLVTVYKNQQVGRF